MECALTGTPGVGKTTVAELLRKYGYEVLDLNDFIIEQGLLGREDQERGAADVDTRLLREKYREMYCEKETEHDIVEGHLSHHLELSPTIVLRCAPSELKKRMEKKGWPDRKIKENLEAEAIDVILIEALDLCREVYEVDTTGKSPEDVSADLKDIFDGKTEGYEPGSLDWSESI